MYSFYLHKFSAHQEALKKEIERLRQVYHQQNIKKMKNNNNSNNSNNNATPPPQQPPSQPMNTDTIVCMDKDQ